MIRTLDWRSSCPPATKINDLLPRAVATAPDVVAQVEHIVADVAARGELAVTEYCEKFDRSVLPGLRVPTAELEKAQAELDPAVREALFTAIGRVQAFHASQTYNPDPVSVASGAKITERHVPMSRVGLYVPGGRAVYPSSVIMNVVPAQVAGVQDLIVVSPPQQEYNGLPHPLILATCALLGVTEVWAVGGAQAVAMLAHGLPGRLPPVDLITGPGNIWVATAKRLVHGLVGIDSEAGPTEVMILADDSASARVVASDLISQAEHDTMAAAVLVTTSAGLADAVAAELARVIPASRHADRIAAALTGPQSAIVLVADLTAAVAVANAYGAEHLEIHTEEPQQVSDQITNAGAVFLGEHSPVSLGDYAAGSNHVLPTGGTSAYSSGLGVATFLRRIQVIDYDRGALAELADVVYTLSAAEDLPAHGEAIRTRLGES